MSSIDYEVLLDEFKIFIRNYKKLFDIVQKKEIEYISSNKKIDINFFDEIKKLNNEKYNLLINFFISEKTEAQDIDFLNIFNNIIYNIELKFLFNLDTDFIHYFRDLLPIIKKTRKNYLNLIKINNSKQYNYGIFMDMLKKDLSNWVKIDRKDKIRKHIERQVLNNAENQIHDLESQNFVHLYRFTSFLNLVDMVERKKLILVKPELWDDKNELFFKKNFFKKNKFKDFLIHNLNTDSYYKNKINKKYITDRMVSILFALIYHLNFMCAQSWTKTWDGNDKWNSYVSNSEEAVRICVKKDSLDRLSGCNGISYLKMRYVDNFDIKNQYEELRKSISGYPGYTEKFNSGQIIRFKDLNFKNENEYRIYNKPTHCHFAYFKIFRDNINQFLGNNSIFDILENDNHIQRFLEKLKEENDKLFRASSNISEVNISPKEFIEFVTITPNAQPHIVNIIETYCKNHGIKCLGQSKLNELK
jgi:hypothetical protein